MQAWKGYQFAHLIRPTDVFYRDLWINPNSSATGGMWAPSYWVRTRFQQPAATATVFRFGLLVRLSPLWAFSMQHFMPHPERHSLHAYDVSA